MSARRTTRTPTLLVVAGGTGGHIFPGLAVTSEMRRRDWRVLWCGHPERMEGQLVPQHQIELLPLRFGGVRGKGLATYAKLPFTLGWALLQAWRAVSRARPDVVLGMGGYVALPLGLVAWLRRVPLVVHEQNAVAGSTNKVLARFARRVLGGFPGALPGSVAVGNPVSSTMMNLPPPADRYHWRIHKNTRLRLLVLGGSLGAQALNEVVPKALARLPEASRPEVRHQCGRGNAAATQAAYQRAGQAGLIVQFITNMAEALTDVDVVVCRAGAMTVSEVAAVGVAALFVPFPHAIDDHQTANARQLVADDAAWLCPQNQLTPEWLADWLAGLTRERLSEVATRARSHARPNAAREIAEVCAEVAGVMAGHPLPQPLSRPAGEGRQGLCPPAPVGKVNDTLTPNPSPSGRERGEGGNASPHAATNHNTPGTTP